MPNTGTNGNRSSSFLPGCRQVRRVCLGILASLAAFGLLGVTACRNNEAEKAALRAADIADCNRLMSLHAWYHAAMQNDVELEKIWSNRPDVIWAQQSGYWKGMDHIKQYYGQKATPDTTTGGYVWHTITSGVVEIAADRQTAKGVWYTPGLGGKIPGEGKPNAGWMWEKYGVDFVREDGQWKVWHMKVYTDWAAPLGGTIGDQGGMGGPPPSDNKKSGGKGAPPKGQGAPQIQGGKEKIGTGEVTAANGGQQQQGPAPGQPNWDYYYKTPYQGWAKGVSPRLVPRPPEPYKTFSETWSYADENE